ncbi:helix-turn-helix transcriptional regulator [Trinickia mobilis]|uniref:helix-turn-helix transcriptional regulator n=1 Tax=Trinickia mobilis TaxID=2816356 RepID=UPI001A90716F|nr:WYL domain-containing protein [Trinickia mobilis]
MFESPLGRIDAMRLLLIWEGEIGRSRVMNLFGMGETRASQWIKELRDVYPDATRWDTRTRTFKALECAYKQFDIECTTAVNRAASLSRYLTLTGLPLDDPGRRGDCIQWASYPELSAPAPATFAALRQAILSKSVVEIEYASMQNPESHYRRISPHGLVKAGRRWHVRAYCERAQGFRDFALGRISSFRGTDSKSEYNSASDRGWNTWVTVQLIAHPGLSKPQTRVIRQEYFGGAAHRDERCRGSLLHYFLQDLMVAVDIRTQHAPDYQLAVGNSEEVGPWLFR